MKLMTREDDIQCDIHSIRTNVSTNFFNFLKSFSVSRPRASPSREICPSTPRFPPHLGISTLQHGRHTYTTTRQAGERVR